MTISLIILLIILLVGACINFYFAFANIKKGYNHIAALNAFFCGIATAFIIIILSR